MLPENQLEFLQALLIRRPLFTYVFFGVNIFLFLLMALAGGSTNEATLIAFGVKSNPEIASGQWWRFITPIFIHIGMMHLLFNSYALWIVGPQVEKLYGTARFVILYVLTGAVGVYGSYAYHPQSISAGASGAIFGLFGVLLVFGIRYRDSVPPEFKRAVGAGVVPIIVINLIIGFTVPAIDNAAHISGLLAGGALAAVVPFPKPGGETTGIFKSLQVLLLVAIVISFYMVAKNYDGPRLSVRNISRSFTLSLRSGSLVQDFIEAINNAQLTFTSSADALGSGNTGDLSSLKRDTSKSIDQLRKIPSLDSKGDELTTALLRIMQDQYELIKDVERAGAITFAHNVQLKENVQMYERVMSQIGEWVKSNGRQHGIVEKNR